MSFLSWTCIAVWVTALVLQCARMAIKNDPKRDRLYRQLTVATFVVGVGVALQASMAIAFGGVVHVRGAFVGVLILVLLAFVS